jgi:hypothetical protein
MPRDHRRNEAAGLPFQKGRKTQREYECEMERLDTELHLLEPQISDVNESGDVLSELADAWLAAGTIKGPAQDSSVVTLKRARG